MKRIFNRDLNFIEAALGEGFKIFKNEKIFLRNLEFLF